MSDSKKLPKQKGEPVGQSEGAIGGTHPYLHMSRAYPFPKMSMEWAKQLEALAQEGLAATREEQKNKGE